MALTAGTRLGSYEITAPLGAGGMGEVYRARDTKLGRSVAVKILPDGFVSDIERIARFDREAKVLASLNHPNIAALYGVEEVESRHLLVMELVEGETLAQRLQRGPITIEETLPIARQIAEALETAHEQGIVHRDLKPANVKITPEDRVKVLDFGLAKAVETPSAAPSVTNSPTLSMMASQAGLILGTAAYMSPEQAKGLPADQRSDIFSFGVVLYEMLTGRQPFTGDTAPDVLASVLVREADLSALPSNLNPRLHDLIKRCLEKHPKKRWQAIGDVRAEVETIALAPHASPLTYAGAPAPVSFSRRSIPMVIVSLLTAMATSAGWWYSKRPEPGPVVRFPLTLPEGHRLTALGRRPLALSPDGTKIAYLVNVGTGNNQLVVRPLDDPEARPLAGVPTGIVANVVFSPDGRWIAFWQGDGALLRKVSIAGGAPVTLCAADNPLGMSWDGESIVFGQRQGIMRVSANGGEPELIGRVERTETPDAPQLLNDGQLLLFTVAKSADPDRWDHAEIVVQSIGSPERKVIVQRGSSARYIATGHLVYAIGNTLLAVPFNASRQEVTGGPVPMIEGIARSANYVTGAAHYAISDAGVLAWMPGDADSNQRTISIRTANGAIEALPVTPRPYLEPRFAPSGNQLTVGTNDGKEAVIWIYELSTTSPLRRLTFGGKNVAPVWSPDGLYITYQSDREGDRGIFRQRADGGGSIERLTKAEPDTTHVPESWSRDGKFLSFTVEKDGATSIWTLPIDGDGSPRATYQAATGSVTASAFSPDGRWVAYGSTELGGTAYYIFVQPFPPTGAKYQITTTATSTPVWSRDGKQLLFSFRDDVFRTEVRTTPSFSFGQPTPVALEVAFSNSPTLRNFDIAADGRIVFVSTATTRRASIQRINVVLNWLEELKQKVPSK